MVIVYLSAQPAIYVRVAAVESTTGVAAVSEYCTILLYCCTRRPATYNSTAAVTAAIFGTIVLRDKVADAPHMYTTCVYILCSLYIIIVLRIFACEA